MGVFCIIIASYCRMGHKKIPWQLLNTAKSLIRFKIINKSHCLTMLNDGFCLYNFENKLSLSRVLRNFTKKYHKN
jgi:hypothetical protein